VRVISCRLEQRRTQQPEMLASVCTEILPWSTSEQHTPYRQTRSSPTNNSVNEDQLRVGRQRRVPYRLGGRLKLSDPSTTRAIPEHFCDVVSSRVDTWDFLVWNSVTVSWGLHVKQTRQIELCLYSCQKRITSLHFSHGSSSFEVTFLVRTRTMVGGETYRHV